MNKNFVCKVEKDGADLVLLFEPEMIGELGWDEGDIIVFETQPNGSIILNKVRVAGTEKENYLSR